MRIANTVSDSIVDGPGLRFTVFTQGCPHRCPGCHNPDTHDPAGGHEATVDELAEKLLSNPLTDGLTLSGGEPFCQAEECAKLAAAAREKGLNVWTYTGYTYERLISGRCPGPWTCWRRPMCWWTGPSWRRRTSYGRPVPGQHQPAAHRRAPLFGRRQVVLWERPDPLAHFVRPSRRARLRGGRPAFDVKSGGKTSKGRDFDSTG